VTLFLFAYVFVLNFLFSVRHIEAKDLHITVRGVVLT